jgi:hypothetical protein
MGNDIHWYIQQHDKATEILHDWENFLFAQDYSDMNYKPAIIFRLDMPVVFSIINRLYV